MRALPLPNVREVRQGFGEVSESHPLGTAAVESKSGTIVAAEGEMPVLGSWRDRGYLLALHSNGVVSGRVSFLFVSTADAGEGTRASGFLVGGIDGCWA